MTEKRVSLAELTVDGKGSYGIGASAVPYSDDLYTYLRITDIKDDGTLNLQDLKSVDDEKASDYILKPNDIVFARTGASTGRNYFYDGTDGQFVYAGFLIKLLFIILFNSIFLSIPCKILDIFFCVSILNLDTSYFIIEVLSPLGIFVPLDVAIE